MTRSIAIIVAVVFPAMASVNAVAQTSDEPSQKEASPVNPIKSMPPIARAVVDGNIQEVVNLVAKDKEAVNETVRAKRGEKAGYTPLILAAALSNPTIAKVLIVNGAEITRLDEYNRSALWYTAFNGDIQMTEVLVNLSQPDLVRKIINTPDFDLMRTPLHLAVRSNEPKLVDVLLKAGASEDAKDASGETAGDFCRRNSTLACKELSK